MGSCLIVSVLSKDNVVYGMKEPISELSKK